MLARVLIDSIGSEASLLAGTVLGVKDGKHYSYAPDQAAACILAEDTVVPAAGDQWAMAYTHAAVVAPELVWGESVSAEEQKTALTALRGVGIYASEA